MRRVSLIGAAIAVAAVLAPVQAIALTNGELAVRHAAPLPCSSACPYMDGPRALNFDACTAPLSQGSYDQTVFAFGTTVEEPVEVVARHRLAYDTFVCTNTQPSLLVAALVEGDIGECGRLFGRKTVDTWECEHASVSWAEIVQTIGWAPPARDFIVRSYNFLDRGSSWLTVKGPVRIVDDSYVATCPLGVPC